MKVLSRVTRIAASKTVLMKALMSLAGFKEGIVNSWLFSENYTPALCLYSFHVKRVALLAEYPLAFLRVGFGSVSVGWVSSIDGWCFGRSLRQSLSKFLSIRKHFFLCSALYTVSENGWQVRLCCCFVAPHVCRQLGVLRQDF